MNAEENKEQKIGGLHDQLKKLEKEIEALEQKAAADKMKTAESSLNQTA